MIVKPTEFGVYIFPTFPENAKCVIDCFPQQKWEAQEWDDGKVRISRKNVTMYIPKDDFEKHWKEVGK